MGLGDSETCLKKLTESVQGPDYNHRLIELPMDEPNGNWKLLELLQEHRIENDTLTPDLLGIGSCGLYLLHGPLRLDKIVQFGN